jgi:hypothetical protein
MLKPSAAAARRISPDKPSIFRFAIATKAANPDVAKLQRLDQTSISGGFLKPIRPPGTKHIGEQSLMLQRSVGDEHHGFD